MPGFSLPWCCPAWTLSIKKLKLLRLDSPKPRGSLAPIQSFLPHRVPKPGAWPLSVWPGLVPSRHTCLLCQALELGLVS